jgi:hypothetical protein
LTYDLQVTVNQILLTVEGENYYKFVEDGRRAGGMPPLNKIKIWCRQKGIPEKAAFPIARKIGKFGISASPLLQNILSGRQLEFQKEVEQGWKIVIETNLNAIVKQVLAA